MEKESVLLAKAHLKGKIHWVHVLFRSNLVIGSFDTAMNGKEETYKNSALILDRISFISQKIFSVTDVNKMGEHELVPIIEKLEGLLTRTGKIIMEQRYESEEIDQILSEADKISDYLTGVP